MNVVQSYLVTVMRGDFSLYEVRVFMKIVELANTALKKGRATSAFGSLVSFDGRSCLVSIPLKTIMTEGSCDYTKVRKAVQTLMQKQFTLNFPEEKKWRCTTLLNDVEIAQGDGMLKFVSPAWLLQYIVNFIDGHFSMYNLQAALKLPTAYAVRMYWLTCGMSEPIEYPVKMLRSMLGADNKYPKTKDFIKRCVESAREFIERAGLNGFRYVKVMEKNRIKALRLIPVKREEEKPEQLTARATLGAWCPPQMKMYLQTQAGFDKDGLNRNKATLFEFSKIPDWPQKLTRIVERQRKGRKGQGYVIKALKSEIKQFKIGDKAE